MRNVTRMNAAKSIPAADSRDSLVAAMRSPLCYPHPVDRVELIETHISWVLLAGEYAYKIKKPVYLGFLDFSTLALRRHYCEQEVRLNRRTAPSVYLDVVPITGSPSAPVAGGEGEAVEFAVRMRRFPQADRLDERARLGQLTAAHIDALAQCVADFHAGAPRAAGAGRGAELELARDNLDALVAFDAGAAPRAALAALRDWTEREHRDVAGVLASRRREGFVRECHGDLHLGNIVLLRGAPAPFDCLEFNDDLRRVDVMSDVAFVVMDLHHHGLPRLAARFLDTYLARTGDYAGLAVLRFHAVYRALVRAKIAAIRASQPGSGDAARDEVAAQVRLATRLAARPRASLTVMHGLSGSGKTTVSQRLLEEQGAIRLRSDVERKRLHGHDAAALYAESERHRVYGRLEALAGAILDAGYPVIVDAAFLARAERDRFRALARAGGCAFAIASCEAPEAVLRERLESREARGTDASDAGVAVLESQLATQQPLGGEELAVRAIVDTSGEA